jgi:hypothetical protein
MVRALRALVLAAVIATSLLLSGSVASAHSGRHHDLRVPANPAMPLAPAFLRDITWE